MWGESSFTLNDLVIEQCLYGVIADGSSALARCSNIIVRGCTYSGVIAQLDGSIILEWRETSVYENCSDRSKIQIVSPLTKESISKRNKGGRNCGARNGAILNQIEIIEE